MIAINSQLNDLISQSEGRYLSNSELQGIKQYLQTVSERAKIYDILKTKSDPLIRLALKKFMALHPDVMKKHGKRCYYDMTEVMRYIALSVLRDDPQFFKEAMALWETNILAAYQKQYPCLVCYRCLQEVIHENLPSNVTKYMDPYITIMMQALDLPAKMMNAA